MNQEKVTIDIARIIRCIRLILIGDYVNCGCLLMDILEEKIRENETLINELVETAYPVKGTN